MVKAVFLNHGGIVIELELCDALLGYYNLCEIACQLQCVPVAGDNVAFKPCAFGHFCCGSDDIIGFPAVFLKAGYAHGVEDVLEHGKLHSKLLGHLPAPRLIFGIFLMPEGRCFSVKGYEHMAGLIVTADFGKHVQKTVDTLGVKPVRGNHRLLYGIICPVDQTVSVYDN